MYVYIYKFIHVYRTKTNDCKTLPRVLDESFHEGQRQNPDGQYEYF